MTFDGAARGASTQRPQTTKQEAEIYAGPTERDEKMDVPYDGATQRERHVHQ